MGSHRYSLQIITLWSTFLLGTLFHTQLGLMPLFHGLSVAIESHQNGNLSLIFWSMLVFFVLPMFAMIATSFYESKKFRSIHFYFTLLYTILNLLHVVFDLMITPIIWYQIALMFILLFIGLLLNLVSYQWLKAVRSPSHPQKR
ncbi:MAG: hypothetical protein MUF49_25305 [Oculatellaceae cyanobacterium Prado106]|jgi:hypothetical protein|nr:hypothetical protein [Oculatellaceae cyanobacterium Prado106]